MDYGLMRPDEARRKIRQKRIKRTTSGISYGYTQANLVVLEKDLALEFMMFSQRNPQSCPLIDVTEVGSSIPNLTAPNADLKTDIPRYRIYKKGELTNIVTDINEYWNSNLMGFLLGCSYTFESALLNNGISIRHIELNKMVPAYITNIKSIKSGRFEGPIVVSMRPIKKDKITKVIQITSRFPYAHGAPIHIGEPEEIGISDINKPDFGDSVPIKDGEVPVFWCCGVTPQAVAMRVKPDLMITHDPGYMFITDLTDESLDVL